MTQRAGGLSQSRRAGQWQNHGPTGVPLSPCPVLLQHQHASRTAHLPGFPLSRPQSSQLYYKGLGWVITMLLSRADIGRFSKARVAAFHSWALPCLALATPANSVALPQAFRCTIPPALFLGLCGLCPQQAARLPWPPPLGTTHHQRGSQLGNDSVIGEISDTVKAERNFKAGSS